MKSSNFYEEVRKYISSYDGELLTVEEEVFYGEIIQAGGEEAEDAIQIMWEANLRLVVTIVTNEFSNISSSSISGEDLLAVGNIGLRKAVLKFDPHYGNKFSTYARWWIKKEIEEALAKNGKSTGFISMPASASNKINKIRAAKWQFSTENNAEPTPEQISQMTNISVKKVKKMEHMCNWHRGGVDYIGEINQNHDESFEISDTADSIMYMRKAMNALSNVEAYTLIMRDGLHDGNSYTLEAISNQIGKTRERVRQIQNEAQQKLRKIMDSGEIGHDTREIDYHKVIEEIEKCSSQK